MSKVITFPSVPRGIYYYRSLWGCLKRASNKEGIDDGGPDAEYGSALHEWLAAYHAQEPLPQLNDVAPPYSCSEVDLAERYADTFPIDIFGEVLMMEQMLEGVVEVPGFRHPVRGRIDMVVDLDPPAAERLYQIQGVQVEPGLYLVDHKTKKSHTATLVPSLIADPQFTMYHELLRQNYSDLLLRGTLVNILFRYVKPRPEQFMTFTMESPGEAEIKVLQTVVHGGAERLRVLGEKYVSPTECYSWNRECPLMFDCSRSNDV